MTALRRPRDAARSRASGWLLGGDVVGAAGRGPAGECVVRGGAQERPAARRQALRQIENPEVTILTDCVNVRSAKRSS